MPPSPSRLLRRKDSVWQSSSAPPRRAQDGVCSEFCARFLWRGGTLSTLHTSLARLGWCRELWLTEVDDEAAAEVAAALRPHRATKLEVLGLSAAMSDAGGVLVADALAQRAAPALAELHLSGNRLGDGTARALARALRAGGVAALWTGAGVLVARGAALTGGQLTAYDATKTGLKARGALREGPALHLVASVHGALWATTLAMPLDNLMARYQAEPGRYRGPWRCAAELVRAEGPAVLMRGWGPMFVRLAPMHVVNATLFEQVRFLVGGGYYE